MGLSTEGLSTWQHETHAGRGSWDENKSNYWHGGSHRVMWECSLRNWHVLPFCGFMWIIKKSWEKNFTSASRTWLFIVAVVQAVHRRNLLKGHIMFFIGLLLLLARLVLWLLIKHVCILYTDGKDDLSDRGNPNQKAQTIHFQRGEKLTSARKASWKTLLSQKTSGGGSSRCAGWAWLTAHHPLCATDILAFASQDRSGGRV